MSLASSSNEFFVLNDCLVSGQQCSFSCHKRSLVAPSDIFGAFVILLHASVSTSNSSADLELPCNCFHCTVWINFSVPLRKKAAHIPRCRANFHGVAVVWKTLIVPVRRRLLKLQNCNFRELPVTRLEENDRKQHIVMILLRIRFLSM